jgi:hypothetical protein
MAHVIYTVLKKIVIKPLLPEALKTKVGVLDDIILRHLSSWAEQGTVVSKIKAKEVGRCVFVTFILSFKCSVVS